MSTFLITFRKLKAVKVIYQLAIGRPLACKTYVQNAMNETTVVEKNENKNSQKKQLNQE